MSAVGRSTALRRSGLDKITVVTGPERSVRTAGFVIWRYPDENYFRENSLVARPDETH
jgi:hypothetical protein